MEVDLKTVLMLTDVAEDEDLVYLRHPEDVPEHMPGKILTLKQVREKYDLCRTKVIKIGTYFCGDKHEGILLTITKGGSAHGDK